MSSRCWVTWWLVSLPEIFCWVFSGRTPRSEMLLVGLTVVAEFQQVPAGVLGGGVARPGDARDVGEPGEDGVAELLDRGIADVRRDIGQAGVEGLVPGADQAPQRPLCLFRPDGAGPALGGVLEVPDQVRATSLVPGDVLPPVVEVVDVPVRDHHAGEVREDAELPERGQGAVAGEQRRV